MEDGTARFEKFAKFAYTAFFVSLGVGAFILWSYDIISKELEYKQKVMPICEKVMRKFDENKNGTVEDQEGIMLAKALGCFSDMGRPELIPEEGVKYNLFPGCIAGYPRPSIRLIGDPVENIENSIYLAADGPNYFTRTAILPLSKLEEIANK